MSEEHTLNQTSTITDERRQELRASFDLFDPQRTGKIEASRTGMLLRACGMQPTEARLEDIVRTAEKNGGLVSFTDFERIMSDLETSERPLMADDVLAAFRVFDESGSGFLRVHDLRTALTTMGERLSDDEFDQLMLLAQVGDNGLVDYRELSKKMVG